jgi:hypothetical protein
MTDDPSVAVVASGKLTTKPSEKPTVRGADRDRYGHW